MSLAIAAAVRRSVIILIALSCLSLMHYFAPLQACTVAFYVGLVVALAGAISMAVPLRVLDVRTRKTGACAFAAGAALAIAALNWPANRTYGSDAYLPAYDFSEFHEERIHASLKQVYEATRQTTMADLRVCALLMRVRRAAEGRFEPVGRPEAPILETMTSPGSGFVVLADAPYKGIALGLAGKPWHASEASLIASRDEYLKFDRPGSVKVLFNIRIEDAGRGWSRITTETRIAGTDGSGTRRMAPYWRVIYPGSGMIRRMWLRAIKSRAERSSGNPA